MIRFRENPWEEWSYPRFVEAARRMELPGYVHRVDAETKRFVSDTGELSLDYGRGLLTINTPNAKSAIGLLADAGKLDLDGMTVDCKTEFATITATSLDGRPIARSSDLLVTLVSKSANTGYAFDPARVGDGPVGHIKGITDRGRWPIVVKRVSAEVQLPVRGTITRYNFALFPYSSASCDGKLVLAEDEPLFLARIQGSR